MMPTAQLVVVGLATILAVGSCAEASPWGASARPDFGPQVQVAHPHRAQLGEGTAGSQLALAERWRFGGTGGCRGPSLWLRPSKWQGQVSGISGHFGDPAEGAFNQDRAFWGAIVTRSFTAGASFASSVMNALAWSWVRATYSASNVSGHPSWSAIFHATF